MQEEATERTQDLSSVTIPGLAALLTLIRPSHSGVIDQLCMPRLHVRRFPA